MMDRKYNIILASKSPRRRELLARIAPGFEVVVEEVDEELPLSVHPREGVEILAVRKGAAVAKDRPLAMVISSDTLVELDGVPLGKPRNEDHAKEMLSALSGRRHNVHTGVAVHYMGRVFSGVDSTSVRFRDITPEEIDEYVSDGEPMDKAGAYGIQGKGGRFVLGYDGEFDTVMGLSLSLTEKLIAMAEEAERE